MNRKEHTNRSTDIPSQGLPESPELERAVLGALLLEPAYLPEVQSLLTGETFADPVNRRIYEAMLALEERGKSTDLSSVASALRAEPGNSVPPAYLAGLSIEVGSGVNCVAHARQLKDTETRRRLVLFGYELATRAMSDPDGVLDWATTEVSAIGDRAVYTDDLRPLGAVLKDSLAMLEARCRAYASGQSVGVTTGLRSLDACTGGWRGGQLVVVAGRPGMGKSAAALHFMASAARQGTPVCFFSLEMRDTQLSDRLLIGRSRVDAAQYRAGSITSDDWSSLERVEAELAALPVSISDRPSTSMAHIRAQCRRMHRRGKCGMAVIDYLQLLDGDDRQPSREREVANMSRAAKQLAKELDIPVIILAQLSRRVEERPDKTPLLSDLRESGAIEQDADLVLFIMRPEYYGISTVETRRYGAVSSLGVGRFIIAKQRDGRVGEICFRYNQSVTGISDYDGPDEPDASTSGPF